MWERTDTEMWICEFLPAFRVCLGLVWYLSGASLVPLVDNLGASKGPVQQTSPKRVSPTNISVRVGIRERDCPTRSKPFSTELAQRAIPYGVSPYPIPHKGKRGGETVDEPCLRLTHLVTLLTERERQGDVHMLPSRCPSSSDTRMGHVALSLPFQFWKEVGRVSQWLGGIVDRFPSPLPLLERDGEMVG